MCAADILGRAVPISIPQDQQRLLALLLREDALPLVDVVLAESQLVVLHLARPLGDLPALLPAGAPLTASVNSFVRRESVWHLCFLGHEAVLPTLRGLSYLHYLLGRPGKDVEAEELIRNTLDYVGLPEVSEDEACEEELFEESDLGPLADDQAIHAARQRVKDLDVEIEDARRNHDLGRLEHKSNEKAKLTKYLGSVLNIRGEPRPIPTKDEKARQSCRAAIVTAIAAIERQDPALATHLRQSVHTGGCCRYTPCEPVLWQL
jgi:hypothetical protein